MGGPRGASAENAPSPQGFDPLPTQRVPPLYIFWLTDPKSFLKVPLTPICTNFERGARTKNTLFFGQHFQKMPKNAFLAFFLKVLLEVQKIWPKQGLFSALEEL